MTAIANCTLNKRANLMKVHYDDEVENLEVLFFSTRLLRTELFQLPVSVDLRLTGADND